MISLPAPKRIQHVTQGNPLWPLPADYHELTVEGQRQARVNACMQHMLLWGPTTDDYDTQLRKRGRVYVDSLNFFDRYYLCPSENHDPMFYDQMVEPAPIHFQISFEGFVNKALMQLLPRGLAKSTRVRVECLHESLVRVPFSLIYTTSSHSVAEETGESMRMQYAFNERIIQDFGALQPKKGEGSFNSHRIKLKNGFIGRFTSIDSKQRGFRPLKYVLDDVEADAKDSTDMETVRDQLDTTINKVIQPMLRRPNTRFRFVGTPISNQHLITRLAADLLGLDRDNQLDDHPSRQWARVAHALEDTDGRSVWPAMYPTDEEEKLDLGLHPETETLREVRERVGEAAYFSEYLLKPGRGKSGFFPVVDEDLTYRSEGDPLMVDDDPAESTEVLVWTKKGTEDERRLRIADVVKARGTFMLVDSSYGSGPTSDWKVWHVMCRTSDKEFVSLDMGHMRAKGSTFIQEILRQGNRWRCHTIYPEYVVSQREFCSTLEQSVGEGLVADMEFVPRVKRLSVHNEPKSSRIQSLGAWMDNGLIRLPARRVSAQGDSYQMLKNQIESFNPEARDGGLAHDDHLDTLAASIKTPKSVFRAPDLEEETEEFEQMMQAYLDGEDMWGNFRIAEMVPWDILSRYYAQRVPRDTDTGAYSGSSA